MLVGGFILTFLIGVWTGYEARPTIEAGITLLKMRNEELTQQESSEPQDAASEPRQQVDGEQQSNSAIENKVK